MNQSPPIIVIGAGRSGTNMLRDILVQLPGLKTWPCDEINYIWRHGNRDFPTDEFTRDMATPRVASYIRKQFGRLAHRTSASTVVEKTCANSLRCGFVDAVVPDARFIHIVRDGRDVALSAKLRWKAQLDLPYILRKARYVPLNDLAWYGGQYFANRIRRVLSDDGRLAAWGPRFEGMRHVFTQHSIAVACAIQWQTCVKAANQQLASIDPSQVCTIRYEDFTNDPSAGLGKVADFLRIRVDADRMGELTRSVSKNSVGQWRTKLAGEEVQEIESQVAQTLERLGYETSCDVCAQ